MRELLITKTNNPVEIPENKSGKNDFVKNLLSYASRISIELSPNSNFSAELLTDLAPQFLSVTWLGTPHFELPTQKIPAIVLARKFCDKGFPVLMHLAGRNLNKQRMLEVLNELKDGGVKNILALQGDWTHVLEKDDSKCDFPYAANLVSFIKEHFGDQFCVGVAGYPEKHPRSLNLDTDIKFLQEKVSTGADFIITQAAFEYEVYERFAKTCRKQKIVVPILAGIFIIKSYKTLVNMAKLCGFLVPKNMLDFVEKNQDNTDIIENYGADLATNLIGKILANKELFAGVHIFSMNDMETVVKVTSNLKDLDDSMISGN